MPISPRFPLAVVAAAQASAQRWGIPASVSLAQWALESAYGKSMPKGSNNPFGIKGAAGAPNVATATHEEIGGRLVPTTAWFKFFPDLPSAFDAHAKLLATGRPYAQAYEALKAGCSVSAFVNLFAKSYATDAAYATKLLSIIHVDDLSEADVVAQAPKPQALPASQKGPTMTTAAPAKPTTASATGPNLLTMIKDFVSGVVGKLQVLPTVLNAAPGVVEGAVTNASEIETAIGELLVVIKDIESGTWGHAPKDLEDLLKTIFDVLSKFGVNLPVLTAMVAKLPELPAIG